MKYQSQLNYMTMKNLEEILEIQYTKHFTDYVLTDGNLTYVEIYPSSERGYYDVKAYKYGARELQNDGFTLKRKKQELKKLNVKGIKAAKTEAINLLNSLYVDSNSNDLTQRENKMLIEIMQCECDGLGRGFSEFDGIGLSPEEKGVLSSLIQKEMVYDCYEDEPTKEKMFCTNLNEITKKIAEQNNFRII